MERLFCKLFGHKRSGVVQVNNQTLTYCKRCNKVLYLEKKD